MKEKETSRQTNQRMHQNVEKRIQVAAFYETTREFVSLLQRMQVCCWELRPAVHGQGSKQLNVNQLNSTRLDSEAVTPDQFLTSPRQGCRWLLIFIRKRVAV